MNTWVRAGGAIIPTLLAVSLKMYLDPAQTSAWVAEIIELAGDHAALVDGHVRLVIFPTAPMLARTVEQLTGTSIRVGGQDLFYEDRGAFTGGISGTDLRQLGCDYVEIGHVERRTIFGEDDLVVNRKMLAAWRNDLIPVLCVGESLPGSSATAVVETLRQVDSALQGVDQHGAPRALVIAYEPGWAIGEDRPAAPDHVADVIGALRSWLTAQPTFSHAAVIYGGSAQPGTLAQLGANVDGLFLGRFAHDVGALRTILDETMQLR